MAYPAGCQTGLKMAGTDDADVCQHCLPEEVIQSDDADMTHIMVLYTVYWDSFNLLIYSDAHVNICGTLLCLCSP